MLTGTLGDVGLDELAALMHQQGRTGVLTLSLDGGAVRILFRDGMICQVDDENRPPEMYIGELLVAGGLISRPSLAMALEQQHSNRKPLGASLVGMGALSLTDLFRYLDLQFRETLYPLYNVTEGRFVFDTVGYAARNCAPPPLPVEDVAMEALRRIDEMPEITQWVPEVHTHFHKAEPIDQLPPGGPLAQEIGKRERTVFAAIGPDENTDATRLVGRTCFSTFDIMKALATLYRAGHLLPTEPRGQSGAHSGVAPAIPSGFAHKRAGFIKALWFCVTVAICVATMLLLLVQSYLAISWSPEGPGVPFQKPPSIERQFQISLHLNRLESAVEVYRLQTGRYPTELSQLIENNLVREEDLTYPDFTEPYGYELSQYQSASYSFQITMPRQ